MHRPQHNDDHRSVRSFVRREGRLTHGQQRALDELWPRFGVAYAATELDLDGLFGRHAPRVLEIGFGNGEALASMAQARPDMDFIGVEVHRPGVGHLLLQIERLALTNVRIVSHDAIEVLHNQLPAAALQRVHLFFPDPWPKKRHHKRRIVQPPFLQLLAARTVPGATLHMATDWENYAEQMFEVLDQCPYFDNVAAGGSLAEARMERPATRPETKFELRGRRRGHDVWDLLATRNAVPVEPPPR